MKILLPSLFLCFVLFASHAQENIKDKESVKIEACYPACRIKLSKNYLMNAEVFVGDVSVKVTQFTMKISGVNTRIVIGNKVSNYGLERMNNLKISDFV